MPDLCTPAHLAGMLEVAAAVEVMSPNSEELGGFWADETEVVEGWERIEELAGRVLAAGVGEGGRGAVVVRAGREGCLVATRELGMVRLPAFYGGGEGSHEMVVDPTGGGNTFIGALGVGMVRYGGDVVAAAAMGNVAASLAIEQVGIPTLTTAEDGTELWNGVSVRERLNAYLASLKTRA